LGADALPATWFPRTTDGTVLRATEVECPIFFEESNEFDDKYGIFTTAFLCYAGFFPAPGS
jgi:hypothetical protein